jgi:hypothetical protein
VHLLDSLDIIAGFSPFVKPKNQIFSAKAPQASAKGGCFPLLAVL